MIGGYCSNLVRDLSSSGIAELVCMNLGPETQPRSLSQNLFRLRRVERALLAEDIAERSKLFLCNSRKHLVGNGFDVFKRCLVGWNCMSTEEGRHYPARMACREILNYPQNPKLVV